MSDGRIKCRSCSSATRALHPPACGAACSKESGQSRSRCVQALPLCCRELWGKIAALPAAAKRSISKLESVLFRVCAQCAATVALFDPSSHSRCHMSPVVAARFIFLILSHFQGDVCSCVHQMNIQHASTHTRTHARGHAHTRARAYTPQQASVTVLQSHLPQRLWVIPEDWLAGQGLALQ